MSVKITVGAVVELKSGGPLATVVRDKGLENNKVVEVAWFNGSDLNREVLPKDALNVKAGAPGKGEGETAE